MTETNDPLGPSGDVFDERFWKERLIEARKNKTTYHAIYNCTRSEWQSIADSHTKFLYNTVRDNDSVLDVGCAWGRLLDLLPDTWNGEYLGVDLSPDFIEMAKKDHPTDTFVIDNFVTTDKIYTTANGDKYDWAIMISLRPMILRVKRQEVWDVLEANVRKSAKNLIFLEYTHNRGTIE